MEAFENEAISHLPLSDKFTFLSNSEWKRSLIIRRQLTNYRLEPSGWAPCIDTNNICDLLENTLYYKSELQNIITIEFHQVWTPRVILDTKRVNYQINQTGGDMSRRPRIPCTRSFNKKFIINYDSCPLWSRISLGALKIWDSLPCRSINWRKWCYLLFQA